jgi:glutamyl-tRNA reductase
LVDKVKKDEAASKAQAEAQKHEIKDLQKQLARAKEERVLEETKRELSDQLANHLEISVKELRASQRKCYVKSIRSDGMDQSRSRGLRGNPE